MNSKPIIVLKFGSSVLRSPDDAPNAVHEIYRWVREGWRVIGIVSALDGETDDLWRQAYAWDSLPHSAAAALLASTGELRSAALLTLALDRAGIEAQVLDVAAIGLRTRGVNPFDAKPVGLNTATLLRCLDRFPVLILPGYLGRDSLGRTTLLGRGGSDCSALFLAHQLGARCRLIKDVDGLYEWDPHRPGSPPRRYAQLSWEDALRLDGGIVQHKAIELAQRNRQEFEVGSLYSQDPTRVGNCRAVPSAAARPLRPLRVLLLGHGTVGRGVYASLQRLPALFHVIGVCVRNKSRSADLPPEIVLDDWSAALRTRPDVLVELIGDSQPAYRSISWALQRGIAVVTANKRVVAEHGRCLESLASRSGASLRWSAAAGGALPILEELSLNHSDEIPETVHAVLNGTSNFVLDRWQSGASLESALEEARAAGLAETDSDRDLNGLDAADKLVLVHRQLTGQWLRPEDVSREPLEATLLERFENGPRPVVRQVASWSRHQGEFRLRVSIRRLSRRHRFAQLKRAENGALIHTPGKQTIFLRGKGAGRWPTTEAVLADLFDLEARRIPTAHFSVPQEHLPTLAEVTP